MNKVLKAFGAALLLASALGMPPAGLSQKTSTRGDAPPKPAPAARSVPLSCVPRSGKTCASAGYGCLVIFGARQWASARRSLDKEGLASALEGVAAVRGGEAPSLYYELKSRPPEGVSAIPVEKDVPLDEQVARSLGFKRVTILRGEYRVDPALGKFGAVVFGVAVER